MNVRKKIVLEKLVDYFVEQGKILTREEYRKAKDTPVRAALIPRIIGPWARIESLIKNAFPEKYALIGIYEEDTEDEDAQEEKPTIVFPDGAK